MSDEKGENKKHEEHPKSKKQLKDEDYVGKIYSFSKSNTQDTVAYVLLFLGIILLFFRPEWGGLLVGGVGGYYYSEELISVAQDASAFIDREGLIRSLILGGVLLAFLIKASWIFIGLAIGAAIKRLIVPARKGR